MEESQASENSRLLPAIPNRTFYGDDLVGFVVINKNKLLTKENNQIIQL